MNPPVSGISFFISLVILVIGGLWRLLGRALGRTPGNPKTLSHSLRWRLGLTIVSFFVIMGILLAISFATIVINNEHNNFAVIENALITCEPFPREPLGDRLIILRLDDVQAFGWTDISITMMEDTLARNMPIVAGTIAKDISTDLRITTFFDRHHCNLEVALHGYDHGIGEAINYERDGVAEFEFLNRDEARSRLSRSLLALSALPSSQVSTFIPPQNLISPDARSVLGEYGITYLSTEGTGIFDYHATTWDFTTGDYVYAKQVIDDCEAHFAAGHRLCVIMLHPQDYALADATLNQDLYRDYGWLLDDIEQRDYQVVTFQDLNQDQYFRVAAFEQYAQNEHEAVPLESELAITTLP